MGMAHTEIFERPKLRKRDGEWRIYYCDIANRVWYRPFWTFKDAVDYIRRYK